MLYELILINEIEQRAKIIFLSVYENLGAPNFCAGAPKKKRKAQPVHKR